MNDKLTLEYWIKELNNESYWIECMTMIHKDKDIQEAIKQSFGYLLADEKRLQSCDISDFKKFVSAWAGRMRATVNRIEATQKYQKRYEL
jgi:hypothetical protein